MGFLSEELVKLVFICFWLTLDVYNSWCLDFESCIFTVTHPIAIRGVSGEWMYLIWIYETGLSMPSNSASQYGHKTHFSNCHHSSVICDGCLRATVSLACRSNMIYWHYNSQGLVNPNNLPKGVYPSPTDKNELLSSANMFAASRQKHKSSII